MFIDIRIANIPVYIHTCEGIHPHARMNAYIHIHPYAIRRVNTLLQCVAACCNTCECIHPYAIRHVNTLLQCVAVCCNTCECIHPYAIRCVNTLLQCVAVCCSVLQYTWMYTSICNQTCEYIHVSIYIHMLRTPTVFTSIPAGFNLCVHMCVYIHTYSYCGYACRQSHTCEGIHPYAPHTNSLYDNTRTQCVAVCCSVLQCVAVCCSVFQCVAVCCSVLQCVAVFCSEPHTNSLYDNTRSKKNCLRMPPPHGMPPWWWNVAVCCSVL